MVAWHKHVFIFHISTQVAAPHAADGSTVQSCKASVLQDPEGYHPLIRDGVQGFPIAGSNDIGGVVHFHLTPLPKCSVFHIHVKHCDSLCFSGVGIGSYICHIFAAHTCLYLPDLRRFSFQFRLKTSYHKFVNLLTGSLWNSPPLFIPKLVPKLICQIFQKGIDIPLI